MRLLITIDGPCASGKTTLAEKLANQAPVKIIFPIVLFIFPAVLVVILVPLAVKMLPLLGNWRRSCKRRCSIRMILLFRTHRKQKPAWRCRAGTAILSG